MNVFPIWDTVLKVVIVQNVEIKKNLKMRGKKLLSMLFQSIEMLSNQNQSNKKVKKLKK